jgi:hypothetical protein
MGLRFRFWDHTELSYFTVTFRFTFFIRLFLYGKVNLPYLLVAVRSVREIDKNRIPKIRKEENGSFVSKVRREEPKASNLKEAPERRREK